MFTAGSTAVGVTVSFKTGLVLLSVKDTAMKQMIMQSHIILLPETIICMISGRLHLVSLNLQPELDVLPGMGAW